jgi:hypothetical protein
MQLLEKRGGRSSSGGANGGLPVAARHAGGPGPLRPRSLRDRLADAFAGVRDRCAAAFDAGRDRVLDAYEWLRLSGPQIDRSRLWTWASLPLALLGVIVGVLLLQGDSERPGSTAEGTPAAAGAPAAEFIEQPGFSLALPEGWEQTNPPNGAVFAAQTEDGLADATLWIERAPDLSFKRFERRSLRQLGEIADNPRVADRVAAPTIEGSIVELRADTPVAGGVTTPYRVTLRGAGPFRHYFATAQQPGADPGVLADIELLHSSLRPEVELEGVGSGG